ncbi:MAG: DUF5302 domain-containing protein [Actinomycetia bacterium]|nr:DUF5302 domain-containing protein [Actinomycetes bacterium]
MSKGESASDDVKARFKEALEKKKAHGGRDVSADGKSGKAGGSHGPETSGTQQMFRRKSG